MGETRHTPRFTVAQVAAACRGTLLGGRPGAVVLGVSTDTRTLQRGQAFFALTGASHDGHAHLGKALEAGASLLVVERWDGAPLPPGVAVLRVAHCERALLALAARHRRSLRGTVLAVTGSCGKSTVKDMLGTIMSAHGRCTVAPASYNNRIGVAQTLLSAAPDDDSVVLELGTNHPGEIDELAAAARPHVGVITLIGPVHLEGLGDLAGVREAKAELIPHVDAAGALVLNADDARCAALASRYGGPTWTFGLSERADVRAGDPAPCAGGWGFTALGLRFSVRSAARFNVANAAAALCAGLCAGARPDLAREALAAFGSADLRYQTVSLGGVRFVLDCYNSNPTALRASVESFLLDAGAGRRAVVCGDMLELGPAGPEFHRKVGRDLAALGVDLLFAVGPLGVHVLEGWQSRTRSPQAAFHFPTAEEAWRPLLDALNPGDSVLVKGSRGMHLEVIAERIRAAVPHSPVEAA